MKKIILSLAVASALSAQAQDSIGDSAEYRYSNDVTEVVSVIEVDEVEQVRIENRQKSGELDPRITTTSLIEVVLIENALENCDPIPGMPVKGVKRNVVVEAGVFENTCHYVNYTAGIGEERYLSKNVPFFLVSRTIITEGAMVSKELKSFTKK